MAYKTVFTRTAVRDLRRLEPVTAQRIVQKIDDYSHLDNPLSKAKKLKGFTMDTFRYRIGDYRAVFRLDKKKRKLVLLVILRIAHRKEVYEK